MDGRTKSIFRRGELACHCLLLETDAGLVLVDTGLGLRDVADPRGRLSAFFLALLSPDFREEMTAVRQLQRLGYDAADVKHIVLTHLDFDHAGGLDDFPGATVHMLAVEKEYAMRQATWLDRQRFRPQQWSTVDNWRVYPMGADDKWLLSAGDAYFYHRETDPERPYCTPGLRFYQWMMDKDRAARVWNQHRLRWLKRNRPAEVEIFCGHDVTEYERLSGHSARMPAAAPPQEYGSPRPGTA